MRGNWVQAIGELTKRNEAYVLVTLLAVRGSTPRDTDAKMVVSQTKTYDSIGGGNLEYQVTHKAREYLSGKTACKSIEEYSLGASLGQCCGGHASVLLEHFPATAQNVVLFGGGHVATALMKILEELPCSPAWYDTRESYVAEHESVNVLQHADNVETIIDAAPANTSFLIMTHDHTLDFQLCERILSRQMKFGDVALCGLIGSKSKSAKFRKRLTFRGFDTDTIDHLSCPVGLPEVAGKRPMEVAVSVAAAMLKSRAGSEIHADTATQNVPRKHLLKVIQTR